MSNYGNDGGLPELALFMNKISRVAQQSGKSLDMARGVLNELALFAQAGVVLCDTDGRVISEKNAGAAPARLYKRDADGGIYVDKTVYAGLKSLSEAVWNIHLNRFLPMDADRNTVLAVAPVISNMERHGALLLFKQAELDAAQRIAAEMAAVVAALALGGHKSAQAGVNTSRSAAVRASLDTLSYSELTAAIEIFNELNGTEGCVVASRIAGRSGVTRSAIVNALRKLESASIVESRSLGVKGTHIKVLNEAFLTELAKLKSR